MLREVTQDKKQYLSLLLLGDESEVMIDRYLDRGRMFILEIEGHVLGLVVVTREDQDSLEIQNLAIDPEYQRKGWGRYILDQVAELFADDYHRLVAGTGDSPPNLAFYRACGFAEFKRLPNFFLDHYEKPIYEEGHLLKDKVYLQRHL